MNIDYLRLVANHVWQSTVFAAVATLLTLALRNNHARVRHWVWVAASCKFLVPLSVLIALGSYIQPRTAPETTQSNIATAIDEVSQPFTSLTLSSREAVPPLTSSRLERALWGVWAFGFLGISGAWWIRWRRIRDAVRAGRLLLLEIPIPAVSSPVLVEPAIFGIIRPVLLLPEGIFERLTPAQLEAIVAHELCHVRHGDNLIAAVQMFVETVFWFHPLVWWVGKRMVAERERACDEEVLRAGSDPRVYAEGILNVCKFYFEAPVACVSGVTGSDLKQRIGGIMSKRIGQRLDPIRKLLLMATGMMAVLVPVVIGTVNTPRVRAQSRETSAQPTTFEVASVKRNKTGGPPRLRYNPGGIDFANVPLIWIIGEAYQVPYARISSSDPHISDLFFSPTGTSYLYDIAARAGHTVPKQQVRLMLRALLEDRFKLVLHHEPKVVPVYKLVVAKGGPKLRESAADGEPAGALGLNGFVCHNLEMARFASMLSVHMDRPVVDLTSIEGSYDFSLKTNLPPEADKAALSEWFSSGILTDIQKQLGLQLETDKAPVDYLIVDRVQQPSEN
jgi:bla regulator protein blaR1